MNCGKKKSLIRVTVKGLAGNLCTGNVEAIILLGPGKICGFLGSDTEYVIPIECIKKIGEDIILVEIKEEKFLKNCKY